MSVADWLDQIDAAGKSRVGPKATFFDKEDVGGFDVVTESPTVLAANAGVSVDVYSLARECSSENGSEGPEYQLAVAECTRNYAKRGGVSVTRLLTRSKYPYADGKYSEQAANKWASTRKDPLARHIEAARIALEERSDAFRGAIDFFDPRSQDRGVQNGHQLRVTSEEYILGKAKESMVWIGPVEGIDPYHLMLFAAGAQPINTAPAFAVLEAGRAGKSVVDSVKDAVTNAVTAISPALTPEQEETATDRTTVIFGVLAALGIAVAAYHLGVRA